MNRTLPTPAPDPSPSPARLLAGLLAPLGAVAATVVVLVGRRWLPDPVATHFGITGRPDGSTSRDALCIGLVVAAVIAAGASVAALRRGAASDRDAPVVPLLTAASWLIAGFAIGAVMMHRGVADWRAARAPLWWGVGLPLVLTAAAAWYSSRLLGAGRTTAPPEPTTTIGVAAGEAVAWQRELAPRWPLVLAAGGAVIAVGAIVAGSRWLILSAALVAVVSAAMSRIVVTVDRRGLAVGWGPFRWPVTRIPLHRIVAASTIHLEPLKWGGWGYRGSIRLLSRAAVVLRRGESLHLDLVGGKSFAVTIDDADTAAGVLNDLVARRDVPKSAPPT